jgi:hypothetical protein
LGGFNYLTIKLSTKKNLSRGRNGFDSDRKKTGLGPGMFLTLIDDFSQHSTAGADDHETLFGMDLPDIILGGHAS